MIWLWLSLYEEFIGLIWYNFVSTLPALVFISFFSRGWGGDSFTSHTTAPHRRGAGRHGVRPLHALRQGGECSTAATEQPLAAWHTLSTKGNWARSTLKGSPSPSLRPLALRRTAAGPGASPGSVPSPVFGVPENAACDVLGAGQGAKGLHLPLRRGLEAKISQGKPNWKERRRPLGDPRPSPSVAHRRSSRPVSLRTTCQRGAHTGRGFPSLPSCWVSVPLTSYSLIICRFHLAPFIPIVAASRPSQLLHDIWLWVHSWGFSFQLNASRNRILTNGSAQADSDPKAFPKRSYR